jgi:hypothetical protein
LPPDFQKPARPRPGRAGRLSDALQHAERLLPLTFLLIALPSLTMLASLVPFGEVADEPAQSLRAEALLNGQFVGHRVTTQAPGQPAQPAAGVNADPALIGAALTPGKNALTVTAAGLSAGHQAKWTNSAPFLQISPLAVYAPVFYVPAALGLGLAHGLALSPYHAAILGRFCNIFAYLALGTAALLLAVQARALIFGVLTVPMSLNLAASLNQDGLFIATLCLAAALASRACVTPARGPSAAASRRLAALAIFCAAVVKPPYLSLAVALLLPLPAAGRLWRNRAARRQLLGRAALVLAVALPVAGWFGWTFAHVSAPSFFENRPVGPLAPAGAPAILNHTDALLQLKILLAGPWRILTLPLHSFWVNPLTQEMVGVLGWLDVMLPPWLYTLWYIAAGAAGLAALLQGQRTAAPPAGRAAGLLLLALGVFLTFIGIYLSQYLVWTTVGADFIDGPQGRYLLPLVPFAGLALAQFNLGRHAAGAAFSLVPVFAAVAGLLYFPYFLMKTYYLH